MIVATEQGHLEEYHDDRDPSKRSARRVWVVRDPDDPLRAITAAQARFATGVPACGEAHPGDATLAAAAVDPKSASEARNLWAVEVSYDVAQRGELGVDHVSWEFGVVQQTYAYDESPTPKPVTNSAGEPFAELPTRNSGSIVVKVERNVAYFDVVQAAGYRCCVNSDTFTLDGVSIGQRQALMLGISGSDYKEDAGTLYRTVSFNIAINPDTWDDTRADRGLHELASGKLREIRKGAPPILVEQPWPLNGSGGALSTSTATPAKLVFRPYKALPFAGFAFS